MTNSNFGNHIAIEENKNKFSKNRTSTSNILEEVD